MHLNCRLNNALAAGMYLIILFLWCPQEAGGQKLDFVNYSVEQGLIQSQAQDIIQDRYGFIWVATYGGISRFDGKQFINYTKRNGLDSHFVFNLLQQGDSDLYLGTQKGLQAFNGNEFKTIGFKENYGLTYSIARNDSGQVYALDQEGKLHISNGGNLEIAGAFENVIFHHLNSDNRGNVFGISAQGIQDLSDGSQNYVVRSGPTDALQIKKTYFDQQNRLWVLAQKGLYLKEGTGLSKKLPNTALPSEMTSMAIDGLNHIWIGTTRGAYRIDEDGDIAHIGSQSGLTDNTINEVILDRENNLWFATDADGIYKLSVNSLKNFDESFGLNGSVVMCMAEGAQGEIWLGSLDGGLTKYSGGKFEKIAFPPNSTEEQKINSLHYDSRGTLWIGTLGNGLWAMNDGALRNIEPSEAGTFDEIISIYEDGAHTIWVTTSLGLFYLDGGKSHRISGVNSLGFSVLEIAPDTLLVGTTDGLHTVTNKSAASPIQLGNFEAGTINCIRKWGNDILLGTEDDGILIWDPRLNKIRQCSSKDGLSSDFIFSLYALGPNTLFAGTGKGISKIDIRPSGSGFTVTNFTSSFNRFGPECNLNSVLNRDNNEIWFGTTKGIFVYDLYHSQVEQPPPLIYLKMVDVYPKSETAPEITDSIYAWSSLPNRLEVSHRQNNITFDFGGVYFSNPEGLKYKYQLVGADEWYSEPTSTTKIVYPNLSPGDYRFKALAITPGNIESANSIDYPFSIESPFYQTTWFMILVVGFLIFLGIFTEYIRVRLKHRRLQMNEAIRLDEQKKILERTSEDLHDDLGNKITRITVLADVLRRKVDPGDTEKTRLINQIRENAESLYLSTKDIIWSLTPGKDTIFDTLEKSRMVGVQLFEDTGIEFGTEGIDPALQTVHLPLAIGRNLHMIIKEAFTNILRHSRASEAHMRVGYTDKGILHIAIGDNGVGSGLNGHTMGNGIPNMQKRMERIGGVISAADHKDGGFIVKLQIKIPHKE